jgi:hypothetical protein
MGKVRTWLVVLAAALVGVTALNTRAMAATANTVTPAGTHGHVCEVLDDDGTNQAVICADLVVTSLPDGSYTARGQAEVACQGLSNKNSFPQCANAVVWIGIEDPSVGDALLAGCGHSNGPCSTPRAFFSSDFFEVGNGQCHHNVWATVFWNLANGPGTSIELPASSAFPHGLVVGMGPPNISTAHFNIGNGC